MKTQTFTSNMKTQTFSVQKKQTGGQQLRNITCSQYRLELNFSPVCMWDRTSEPYDAAHN
jgi:hypothetical protein